jgi:hypothetical protein
MEPSPLVTSSSTSSSLSLKSASEFFNKGLLKLDSLSEVIASATTGESNNNRNVHEWSRSELLELTAQLSSKLRRAEIAMRATQERNAAKTELLRRCLMGTATLACDGREEVLELINVMADSENPDVDRDSARYKETLAATVSVLRRHDSDSETRLVETVASLEQRLTEEEQRRAECEIEKAALQARLDTLSEAWKTERESSTERIRQEERAYREKLLMETNTVNEKLRLATEYYREQLQSQEREWQEKVKSVEERTKQELEAAEAAKAAIERIRNARALEQGAEMEQLRARISQLETGLQPEEELVQVARAQASRDALVNSLKKQVNDLTERVARGDRELYEAKRMLNEVQSSHAMENIAAGNTTTKHSHDVEIRLDYLRHCVVRYIVEPPLVKRSLVTVLATILNFSAEERTICDTVVNKLVEQESSWINIVATTAANATTAATAPVVAASSMVS